MAPKRVILEWGLIAAMFALAAAARYLLVQPPDIAHACEAGDPSLGCWLRVYVIRSFATFGLGYAAMVATVLTLFTFSRSVAWIAAMIGAAGLVLYCYEPASLSFATGVLVLARAQSGRSRAKRRQHAQTKNQA